MSLLVSILAGVITAYLECVFISILMLYEMGGPIDFRAPILLLACFALAILAFFLKVKAWWQGLVYGMAFGILAAAPCYSFRYFSEHQLGKQHVGELHYAGVWIVLASIIVLTMRSSTQPMRSSGET